MVKCPVCKHCLSEWNRATGYDCELDNAYASLRREHDCEDFEEDE